MRNPSVGITALAAALLVITVFAGEGMAGHEHGKFQQDRQNIISGILDGIDLSNLLRQFSQVRRLVDSIFDKTLIDDYVSGGFDLHDIIERNLQTDWLLKELTEDQKVLDKLPEWCGLKNTKPSVIVQKLKAIRAKLSEENDKFCKEELSELKLDQNKYLDEMKTMLQFPDFFKLNEKKAQAILDLAEKREIVNGLWDDKINAISDQFETNKIITKVNDAIDVLNGIGPD